MEHRSAADIRERFQRFFEARDHTRVPPAPLLARDDPTLLFVNSGMVPFKRVLTGEEKRDYSRAVDAQPCLRVAGKHNDFEEVGRTPRHHTLFEMLGNWSFGDYFKRDAIHWAWEFLTGELGIPPERLAATVYTDDDEAHAIWADEIGLPPERLVRWGRIEEGDFHNFWQMAETGPCGPCSELHFDRGVELSEGDFCVPDHSETCPRWLEVWNLVFMQYDRAADGTLSPLPFRSVDTGMGLERISSAVQGVDSNYRTDLFEPIITRLAEFIGHDPETVESERFSYQVVADHSRAATFMIGEGIRPSNEGPGYVLRRIVRRAVRHARLMGITQPFLRETCAVVIDLMGDAYAFLARDRARILDGVAAEEEKFARTLEAGSERLAQLVSAAGADGEISGEEAFRLHDTFGFPIDLTVEVASESGVTVDRAGFEAAMDEQRSRSRASRTAAFVLDASMAGPGQRVRGLSEPRRRPMASPSSASGRETRTSPPWWSWTGRPSTRRAEARWATAARSSAPTAGSRSRTRSGRGAAIVHIGRLDGSMAVGETVRAEVDAEARWAAARNHTGTHLLHRALRDVLGEQAKQAGSWVGPDGLRFDFPGSGATSREALRDIERRVNEQIRRDAAVTPEWMSLADAQALGADMFFGEKYLPESVRVVQVDGFSKELCGGTHVARTGQIGALRITGESSIGAGLRRIEAVTGAGAEELVGRRLQALYDAARLLGEQPEQVPARVAALLERVREAEKAAREGGAARASRIDVREVLAAAQTAGEARVIIQRFDDADAGSLRSLADDLRGATGRFVLVAAGAADGKPTLLVAASRDLVSEGFDAVPMVRAAAGLMGGGGGGRPDLAQAGGRDAARLDDAVQEAGRLALETLQRLEAS